MATRVKVSAKKGARKKAAKNVSKKGVLADRAAAEPDAQRPPAPRLPKPPILQVPPSRPKSWTTSLDRYGPTGQAISAVAEPLLGPATSGMLYAPIEPGLTRLWFEASEETRTLHFQEEPSAMKAIEDQCEDVLRVQYGLALLERCCGESELATVRQAIAEFSTIAERSAKALRSALEVVRTESPYLPELPEERAANLRSLLTWARRARGEGFDAKLWLFAELWNALPWNLEWTSRAPEIRAQALVVSEGGVVSLADAAEKLRKVAATKITKKVLEGLKRKGKLPPPFRTGGRGGKDVWRWCELRPELERIYVVSLSENE